MSIWQSRGLLIYCSCVAFALGAVFGSFLNCVAWRITHGESALRGRSHCPSCGHVLGPSELVPIFSWLFLRGRCKSCGVKIPARYPLTELVFAVLTLLCLLRFDLTWLCLRNWVFLGCLFVLTLTDLDDCIIPDVCHIVAVLAWLIGALLMRTPWQDTSRARQPRRRRYQALCRLRPVSRLRRHPLCRDARLRVRSCLCRPAKAHASRREEGVSLRPSHRGGCGLHAPLRRPPHSMVHLALLTFTFVLL